MEELDPPPDEFKLFAPWQWDRMTKIGVVLSLICLSMTAWVWLISWDVSNW